VSTVIHAIQIPADEERPLYKVAIENLEGMQAAVGGYIEFVDLDTLHASMVVNEEGKLEKRPINRRATLMFWLLYPKMSNRMQLSGMSSLLDTLTRTATPPTHRVK